MRRLWVFALSVASARAQGAFDCASLCAGFSCDSYSPQTCDAALSEFGCACAGCACDVVRNGTNATNATVLRAAAEAVLGSIVDVAAATPSSSLVAAVAAAGLVGALAGDGPFTVLAPTNAAFAAVDLAALSDDELVDVLLYHVAPGDVSVDVADDGAVTFGGAATVVIADVEASNGVVHVIDAVLLPFAARAAHGGADDAAADIQRRADGHGVLGACAADSGAALGDRLAADRGVTRYVRAAAPAFQDVEEAVDAAFTRRPTAPRSSRRRALDLAADAVVAPPDAWLDALQGDAFDRAGRPEAAALAFGARGPSTRRRRRGARSWRTSPRPCSSSSAPRTTSCPWLRGLGDDGACVALYAVDGSGHYPHVERPVDFDDQILDFFGACKSSSQCPDVRAGDGFDALMCAVPENACRCPNGGSKPPTPTTPPTPVYACDDVCAGFTCDEFVPATCELVVLEYGCDCAGCRCELVNGTAHALPEAAAAPTATPTLLFEGDPVAGEWFVADLSLDDAKRHEHVFVGAVAAAAGVDERAVAVELAAADRRRLADDGVGVDSNDADAYLLAAADDYAYAAFYYARTTRTLALTAAPTSAYCGEVCGGVSCDDYAPATCAVLEADYGCSCPGCDCGVIAFASRANHSNATTAPGGGACVDDGAWFKTDHDQDCSWVAEKPEKRCDKAGCKQTCNIVEQDYGCDCAGCRSECAELSRALNTSAPTPRPSHKPTRAPSEAPYCNDGDLLNDAKIVKRDLCGGFRTLAQCCESYAKQGWCSSRFGSYGDLEGHCEKTCGFCYDPPSFGDLPDGIVEDDLSFDEESINLKMALVIYRMLGVAVCGRCGRPRHFTNEPPSAAPAAAFSLVIFGGILLVFGALMLRFEGANDVNRLLRLGEITQDADFVMAPPNADGVIVADVPTYMSFEFAKVGTDFPVFLQPSHIIVRYWDPANYEQQIGYIDIPEVEDTLGADGTYLKIGPTILAYEIKPDGSRGGQFTSWVLGDSDLSQRYTYGCDVLANMATAEIVSQNCTGVPELKRKVSEMIRPVPLSMIIVGSLSMILAFAFFERHVREQRAC
ncbi:hypothetical protein JL720_2330 [Aureococcus anophagefferens]|nr:hypothetical protein JL720_2330 [Aureococcus anophagefferens]